MENKNANSNMEFLKKAREHANVSNKPSKVVVTQNISDITLSQEINESKIYYVGFSDDQSPDGSHYICVYNEVEENTKQWCKAVKEKKESNTVMLKLNGKSLKHALNISL